MSDLKAVAERAFPLEGKARRVEVSGDPQRTYVFRSMKINAQAWTYWGYYEYYTRVYVDPYSGQVVYVEDARKGFFDLVLDLHRRLWLGERIGKSLTGYSTIVLFVVLLSGLFIWIPRKLNRKSVKWMFVIKRTTNTKRLNYDFHKVAGFYATLPLALITYSAVVWGFKSFDKTIVKLLNGGQQELSAIPAKPSTIYSIEEVTDRIWQEVNKALQLENKVYFSFPRTAEGNFNVEVIHGHRHYQVDKYNFNQHSGERVNAVFYGDSEVGWGTRLRNMNYDLHTGSILGTTGRIIYLLVGLIAVLLPISGFVIWWGRRK